MNKKLLVKATMGTAVALLLAAPVVMAQGEDGACAAKRGGVRGLDTNRDGKITLEEATAGDANMTEEKFAQRDTNGDGLWTAEDRRGRGMRGGHGAQGGPPHGPGFGPRQNPDADGNGEVTLEEFTAVHPSAEEVFARLDTNGDGVLTEDERPGPGRGMHGGPRGEEGDDVKEGRGGYSRPPRGEGPQGYGPPPGRGPRAMMEEADTDGDGQLTYDEASTLPNMTEERFSHMDRNGDGVLSEADRPERGGRRGGPGGPGRGAL